MKKLFNKNPENTLAELDCWYCLHHQTNRAPCPLKVCCCADEKQAALRKMQAENAAVLASLLPGVV